MQVPTGSGTEILLATKVTLGSAFDPPYCGIPQAACDNATRVLREQVASKLEVCSALGKRAIRRSVRIQFDACIVELNALEDRGLVRRRVAAAAWEGEQARRADEGAMRQVQEVSERLLEKRHAQEVCFGLSECVAAHTRMRSRKSDYALARYGVRASC